MSYPITAVSVEATTAIEASDEFRMSLQALYLVARRFPDWREVVEEQYITVSDFQEMCDDYHEIVTALAYWTLRSSDRISVNGCVPRALENRQAAQIAEDCLEALTELENEILLYLRRHS